MILREWGKWFILIAAVEVALIVIVLFTRWRWHRTGPVRRFTSAVRSQWKRVLLGAFAGWLISSIAGAVVLAELYLHGILSLETSDNVAIAIPLAGVWLGGMVGYATRRKPA